MAERNVGIPGQPARYIDLVFRETGRIVDAGGVGQGGDDPSGNLLRMLQRVFPAAQRGEAEVAHELRLILRQPLQRENRVAVELDAVIREAERFEVEAL